MRGKRSSGRLIHWLCDLAESAAAAAVEVGLYVKTFHQSCSWTLADPPREQHARRHW